MDSHRSSISHAADDKHSEKLDDDECPRTPTDNDRLPENWGQSRAQSRDPEKNESSAQPDQHPPAQATGEKDPAFKVDFEENDPTNPRAFSTAKKAWITLQLGFMALTGSLGSSIIAPAEPAISEYVGVSQEITVFCVALYVLGFAIGPQAWAPISEVYGRKWSMLPPMFCLGLWSIGTAVSQNAASVFITRFFGGVFASAPISNVSAALGDMYDPKARGIAVTFYAVMVVGGPTLGPVIGSSLTVTLGWRWTEYIEAIFAFFMFAMTFFTLPELYGPVLLKRKAKRLRRETGDPRYWHPHEAERMNPSNIVTKYFSRPIRMLVTEPMVTAVAIYASFVYGILYLTLEVFPIVFRDMRGFGPVVSTLPFLGLFVGVLCAVAINLANQSFYAKAVAKNKGRAVPEARLPPMVVGGFLFTAGLFWFGWTAAPKYHWSIPVVAAGFIGAGFNTIFQQCINYLVDTYALYAASAVSANTFLRSIFAFGLPLAAQPMFRNMGVGPAASVLGGISCLALPVPFIFWKYGLKLRKMSKFAPMPED
ncbi:MFS general substrate transporter [Lecanosticta acicola]|uniref:MFS general substrate transporter n=1 Tax=Lecanosticta acicola TaxID=111012 RepID=A0AAI9EF57_9PEZI|nr:MFS general substrate transporter [Lecanosticta acicola]